MAFGSVLSVFSSLVLLNKNIHWTWLCLCKAFLWHVMQSMNMSLHHESLRIKRYRVGAKELEYLFFSIDIIEKFFSQSRNGFAISNSRLFAFSQIQTCRVLGRKAAKYYPPWVDEMCPVCLWVAFPIVSWSGGNNNAHPSPNGLNLLIPKVVLSPVTLST